MTALYFVFSVVAMFAMVYYIRRADELSRGVVTAENGFDIKLKRLNDTANRIGSVIGGIFFILIVIAIVIALFAHFGFVAILFFI